LAKPEWGLKRVCQSCGAKFYDLQRSPILCPKCGAEFDPETVLRSRRGRSSATPEKAVVAAPAAGEVVEEEPLEEASTETETESEDESDLMEDTDDLDDDGDMPGMSEGEDQDE